MRLATVVLLLAAIPFVANAQCRPIHRLSADQLLAFDFSTSRGSASKPILDQGDYRLREVRYFRQNVFPDRNHWLARQANRFNTLTKERTLMAAFPIDVGAVIDETQRQEAERVLRRKPYLYDARVFVRQVCDDQVDLDVVVRDVWTLTPSIGFSRSGGDNESNLALSDVNLLGTGKGLALEYFNDRDRSGTYFRYDDPNLLGSRWIGTLVAADNDDGERYSLRTTRPFFALATPMAGGIELDHVVSDKDLEFLGEDQYEIDSEVDAANLFLARSRGRENGWVHRYYVGARYLDETIGFPIGFPGPTEDVRTFAYPYLGWELIQDSFATRANVDRIGITEDLKLGWSSYAEVGWSTDAFGGDGDHVMALASAAYRFYVGDEHILGFGARTSGRYDLDLGQSEDVLLDLELSYLWQQAEQWRFLTRFNYTYTHNRPVDKQLTLGGDNGLRGYPSRYQTGDRSSVLTLEQRYYSNAYPFGLIRVGYAVFVDVGRAWYEDEVPAWVPPQEGDHFGTLANVGFGLRLESVRTRRDRVFHIDFAKPLVDGPFVNSWEVTLSGKQEF